MHEGICDVVLLQFEIVFGGDRHKHPERTSSQRCCVCVLGSDIALLVSSHYKSCLAFDEAIVLVEFVCVHPHAVQNLVSSLLDGCCWEFYPGLHLLVTVKVRSFGFLEHLVKWVLF